MSPWSPWVWLSSGVQEVILKLAINRKLDKGSMKRVLGDRVEKARPEYGCLGNGARFPFASPEKGLYS